jgi:hypothetical protein
MEEAYGYNIPLLNRAYVCVDKAGNGRAIRISMSCLYVLRTASDFGSKCLSGSLLLKEEGGGSNTPPPQPPPPCSQLVEIFLKKDDVTVILLLGIFI